MATDKTIFGLRFGSNAEINPTQEELNAFLETAKNTGRRELHGGDLARYREMLEGLREFQRRQRKDAAPHDLREKMFYGVLGHSQFISPALMLAVEQYKFHLHAFSTLDFRKPAVFIRSAEEEMSRLNPKKKDDAVKMARLRGMVEERKSTLEMLKRRRAALVAEMVLIARYVRDNLVRIEKLCEASIVVLVGLHISRDEEKRLIEDIKERFKEQLRGALHQGRVSRQDLETVKRDVEILSKEASAFLREDVYSLTRLYEAIHGHTKEFAREIDARMAEMESKRNRSFDDERELFAKAEKVLVSLVSGHHFELKTTPLRSETEYENILLEKRSEMLDRLFELLKKERRSRRDRRTGEDRRKFKDQNIKGRERRTEKDRRSGKNRRDEAPRT